MLFNFKFRSRIRETLANPHKFRDLFEFRACVIGVEVGPACKPRSSFQFPSYVLNTFFSSLSSRNPNPSSHSNPSLYGERDDFDAIGEGSDRFKQMGFGESRDLGHFGSGLDDLDDNEESSDIEESGNDHDDDDLMVLNSFTGGYRQTEGIRRFEGGEDESRHPLVREICRLIELRSAWNPKLEGELRHLLRSLKPRQVCAVLQLQTDERVALRFFYWADRQWRYRHDPIVYYAMLEILSKTKLCQGAKRVLRLMAKRRIERRPEAFGYVMVSYSRAGKLRNAMRVLTMMQKAGIEPDLLICNTAIHVLVMGNRLDKAVRFLERMQIVEIAPNVITYNCLIKGYCDLHRLEDAMELIAEMPFKGCSPDKISYYTVMGFLCKEKRIKEVRLLMEKMLKDSNLLPN